MLYDPAWTGLEQERVLMVRRTEIVDDGLCLL